MLTDVGNAYDKYIYPNLYVHCACNCIEKKNVNKILTKIFTIVFKAGRIMQD